MRNPKVSVVTVVYNDYQHIEETILSVLNQTYQNIEYIIIDGGSVDGTVDIIKKYSHRLSYWVSESDGGIYDAMNKSIDYVSGDWVNFMNSGDVFYNSKVIENVSTFFCKTKASVLYGDVVMHYESIGDIYRQYSNIRDEDISTNLCHQSTFTKSNLLKKYKFDLSFKIAADVNFFTEIYRKEKAVFEYMSLAIAVYEAENGMSAKNLRIMYNEYMRIHEVKKFSVYWWSFFLKNNLKVLYYNLPFGLSRKLMKRRLLKLYGKNTRI